MFHPDRSTAVRALRVAPFPAPVLQAPKRPSKLAVLGYFDEKVSSVGYVPEKGEVVTPFELATVNQDRRAVCGQAARFFSLESV